MRGEQQRGSAWSDAQCKAMARQLSQTCEGARRFVTDDILDALVDQYVLSIVVGNHRDVSRENIEALRKGINKYFKPSLY